MTIEPWMIVMGAPCFAAGLLVALTVLGWFR